MRCYSHLSDDEREQIGLAKALGHSIGAIAQAIGRPRSTVWREARIERDRALRTFVVDRLAEGWTPSKFQAGSGAETNLVCGP
jgi:IS30 family transposase